MIAITKFKADDGSEFDTIEAASKRDLLHYQCKEAMKPLREINVSSRHFYQHDPEVVNQCKDRILDICRAEGFAKNFQVFNNAGRNCHPLSIIGRILNDNGGPLDVAWSRFGRIAPDGKEYDQPYFAYNCKESEREGFICINKAEVTP